MKSDLASSLLIAAVALYILVNVIRDVTQQDRPHHCNAGDVTKDEPAPPPERDVRALTLEEAPLPKCFEDWWQEQARKEK
jgi:hypothetical protein